jgi:uncharacterized protein YneF (UPF0154 family)
LCKWIEEGAAGLDNKPRGQKGGVRKVTLATMEAVRRLQQNPHLDEFRVHAALKQMGVHLSPRTCRRILAVNRRRYGMEKLQGPSCEKKQMRLPLRDVTSTGAQTYAI